MNHIIFLICCFIFCLDASEKSTNLVINYAGTSVYEDQYFKGKAALRNQYHSSIKPFSKITLPLATPKRIEDSLNQLLELRKNRVAPAMHFLAKIAFACKLHESGTLFLNEALTAGYQPAETTRNERQAIDLLEERRKYYLNGQLVIDSDIEKKIKALENLDELTVVLSSKLQQNRILKASIEEILALNEEERIVLQHYISQTQPAPLPQNFSRLQNNQFSAPLINSNSFSPAILPPHSINYPCLPPISGVPTTIPYPQPLPTPSSPSLKNKTVSSDESSQGKKNEESGNQLQIDSNHHQSAHDKKVESTTTMIQPQKTETDDKTDITNQKVKTSQTSSPHQIQNKPDQKIEVSAPSERKKTLTEQQASKRPPQKKKIPQKQNNQISSNNNKSIRKENLKKKSLNPEKNQPQDQTKKEVLTSKNNVARSSIASMQQSQEKNMPSETTKRCKTLQEAIKIYKNRNGNLSFYSFIENDFPECVIPSFSLQSLHKKRALNELDVYALAYWFETSSEQNKKEAIDILWEQRKLLTLELFLPIHKILKSLSSGAAWITLDSKIKLYFLSTEIDLGLAESYKQMIEPEIPITVCEIIYKNTRLNQNSIGQLLDTYHQLPASHELQAESFEKLKTISEKQWKETTEENLFRAWKAFDSEQETRSKKITHILLKLACGRGNLEAICSYLNQPSCYDQNGIFTKETLTLFEELYASGQTEALDFMYQKINNRIVQSPENLKKLIRVESQYHNIQRMWQTLFQLRAIQPSEIATVINETIFDQLHQSVETTNNSSNEKTTFAQSMFDLLVAKKRLQSFNSFSEQATFTKKALDQCNLLNEEPYKKIDKMILKALIEEKKINEALEHCEHMMGQANLEEIFFWKLIYTDLVINFGARGSLVQAMQFAVELNNDPRVGNHKILRSFQDAYHLVEPHDPNLRKLIFWAAVLKFPDTIQKKYLDALQIMDLDTFLTAIYTQEIAHQEELFGNHNLIEAMAIIHRSKNLRLEENSLLSLLTKAQRNFVDLFEPISDINQERASQNLLQFLTNQLSRITAFEAIQVPEVVINFENNIFFEKHRLNTALATYTLYAYETIQESISEKTPWIRNKIDWLLEKTIALLETSYDTLDPQQFSLIEEHIRSHQSLILNLKCHLEKELTTHSCRINPDQFINFLIATIQKQHLTSSEKINYALLGIDFIKNIETTDAGKKLFKKRMPQLINIATYSSDSCLTFKNEIAELMKINKNDPMVKYLWTRILLDEHQKAVPTDDKFSFAHQFIEWNALCDTFKQCFRAGVQAAGLFALYNSKNHNDQKSIGAELKKQGVTEAYRYYLYQIKEKKISTAKRLSELLELIKDLNQSETDSPEIVFLKADIYFEIACLTTKIEDKKIYVQKALNYYDATLRREPTFFSAFYKKLYLYIDNEITDFDISLLGPNSYYFFNSEYVKNLSRTKIETYIKNLDRLLKQHPEGKSKELFFIKYLLMQASNFSLREKIDHSQDHENLFSTILNTLITEEYNNECETIFGIQAPRHQALLCHYAITGILIKNIINISTLKRVFDLLRRAKQYIDILSGDKNQLILIHNQYINDYLQFEKFIAPTNPERDALSKIFFMIKSCKIE